LAAGFLALGLAGIAVSTLPQLRKLAPAPTPPALSVAILPFAAPSDSPANLQFGDAFTKDVTMTLARNLRIALVSSHSLTEAYKGKSIDERAVGRELNVRYVVEGDVQRAGNGLAIRTQLIDTSNGTQVWGDQLETDRSRLRRTRATLRCD
jgi:TolB-like protein